MLYLSISHRSMRDNHVMTSLTCTLVYFKLFETLIKIYKFLLNSFLSKSDTLSERYFYSLLLFKKQIVNCIIYCIILTRTIVQTKIILTKDILYIYL